MRKGTIYAVKIAVEKIHPHPDNPRKELGDLEEMVESIKKNGIMQNLTVIPEEALEKEEADQRDLEQILSNDDENYIVLIGHRRLAAAKRAGIEEIYCKIITGISKKEQIGIMLEENMQRNDLTIWEQANGFQMMLDLGSTEEQIAERTGFSRTTIKRRLNIAKLDQEELIRKEKDESFQLTLKHLYELEKIEDIETRNKIIKESNSPVNLEWRIKEEVNDRKRKKTLKELVKAATDMGLVKAPENAVFEQYSGKWEQVCRISLESGSVEELDLLPEEDEKRPFYYMEWYRDFLIIRKAVKKNKKLTKEEEEKIKREKNNKEIRTMMKELHKKAGELITGIIEGKIASPKEDMKQEIWDSLLRNRAMLSEDAYIHLVTGKYTYELPEKQRKELNEEFHKIDQTAQMLVILWEDMDGESLNIYDYTGGLRKDRAMRWERVLGVLGKYGFYLKEEERKLLDGTHELFAKEGNNA